MRKRLLESRVAVQRIIGFTPSICIMIQYSTKYGSLSLNDFYLS